MTEEEGETHQALMAAMMNIESVAGVMKTDLVSVAKAYLEGEFEESSDVTQELVQGLWDRVRRGVEVAVNAAGKTDAWAAQDVLLLKDGIRNFVDRLFERHANRLQSEDPKYL